MQADLFGAGLDTSLNTVTFALSFLGSPEFCWLQTAVQAELDGCGRAGPGLHHPLPLLRATLLEVERLRPVTPLGVPHGTLATVRLASGAVLPPATMIIPLHWAVNMDTELWDRPEEFRPNR